jgi:uncharacterized protein
MDNKNHIIILGVFIFLGLATLGQFLGSSLIRFREYERTVSVKGLAEKEYPADIVIWPIRFTEADNELARLYRRLETSTETIRQFLREHGVQDSEITVSPPAIIDKSAQQYGPAAKPEFRYSAVRTVTVYSGNIDLVRAAINELTELGGQEIVFTGNDYENTTEYLFTGLNEIKPLMIEEATTKAREVAEKFALDSRSSLGKIKKANQGQFTIEPRDRNNPHIKRIRVVSTVEYYLVD